MWTKSESSDLIKGNVVKDVFFDSTQGGSSKIMVRFENQDVMVMESIPPSFPGGSTELSIGIEKSNVG